MMKPEIKNTILIIFGINTETITHNNNFEQTRIFLSLFITSFSGSLLKSTLDLIMKFKEDIKNRISEFFKEPNRVFEILNGLNVEREHERIIRCILILSEGDYDAVREWVKKANQDYRNIIWYAEYDNRNVRKFNFNYPINRQEPYSYKE